MRSANRGMHTKPMRERLARGTMRRVWLEGQVIVKEFRRVRWPGDLRRPWEREHQALVRLQERGVNAPAPFSCERVQGGVIRLRREFIPGAELLSLTPEQWTALAEHTVAIHAAGVTINDAALDNLIALRNGGLMHIDYGRARVFRFRSPLFYFYVGKELARIRRRILVGSDVAWPAFRAHYHRCAQYPAWAWRIVHTAERYWMHLWKDAIDAADAIARQASLSPGHR